jgi:ribbon-helix-helix CopG family protein
VRIASDCYAQSMRTTVTLPDTLLKNAKRRAAQRGVTLSVLLEDALRSHLARQRQGPPPAFRLHTVRGRLVKPDLDLDRTSAVLASDDELAYVSGRS